MEDKFELDKIEIPKDCIVMITEPEVVFPDLCDYMDKKGMTYIRQYNYDNSHIIFKGRDLGSLRELANRLKIFVCEASCSNYIENDECTVIAENEEKAYELVMNNNIFREHQKPIKIKEIHLNMEQILTISNIGG